MLVHFSYQTKIQQLTSELVRACCSILWETTTLWGTGAGAGGGLSTRHATLCE